MKFFTRSKHLGPGGGLHVAYTNARHAHLFPDMKVDRQRCLPTPPGLNDPVKQTTNIAEKQADAIIPALFH